MEFTKFYLLLLLSGAFSTLFAQNSFFSNRSVLFNVHEGFVLKDKTATGQLSNQHPKGFELELVKQTKGEKEWERLYRYPQTGISIQYWVMNPHKRLGNQLGFVFYVQKHLLRTSRFSMLYRIGVGPGFIHKRFNLYTNNEDNLVSSWFNFVLNGRLIAKYSISPKWSLNASLGIVHFSNGALKMPNQGINIPSAAIGFGYHFAQSPYIHSDSLSPFKRQWTAMFSASGGSKNEYPVGTHNFLVTTISAYFGRALNRKSTIVAGLDFFYDGSMSVWADSAQAGKKWDYTKIGVLFGHELRLGHFALITHLGYLVFKPIAPYGGVYERWGLKYYIKPNVFGMISMKNYQGVADFVEWTVGYRLK